MDFVTLDVEQLRTLYQQKTNELSEALLSGKEWHELKEQRELVTAVAILLHKKLAATGTVSPADFQVRSNVHNDARSSEETLA